MAEWDKLEETNKGKKGKPTVTDMPPRGSNPTEAWRKIDVKVKKTILHRLFIWMVYLSVLIHFLMLVSQIIGVYFYWVWECTLLTVDIKCQS